ncbi:conserved hypothetical protein [Culex quinquefasciatus]|uniref:Uncharacterized protein n=1 Tax=Culex quinquefasciatus TaxID=7176 RepID=B0WDN7_CULQU|nr:conserved hypothetical protein [Culex quinquefasciatus]|eukprot:XP_001846821.1 conserved hypothetical protein [Culex quinquefasciatus]
MSDEDEERDRFIPLAFDQEETKSCFTEYSMSSSVIWRNELCTKWRSINPKTGLPMNVLGATVRVKSPGPNGRCNGSTNRPRSKKLLKEYRVERRIERKVNTLTVKDEEKQKEKRQLNSRVNAGKRPDRSSLVAATDKKKKKHVGGPKEVFKKQVPIKNRCCVLADEMKQLCEQSQGFQPAWT